MLNLNSNSCKDRHYDKTEDYFNRDKYLYCRVNNDTVNRSISEVKSQLTSIGVDSKDIKGVRAPQLVMGGKDELIGECDHVTKIA